MFVIGSGPPAKEPQGNQQVTPLAHVELRGTGPIPMILIPPYGCDWRVYEGFMKRNASRYSMFSVTLPGFGDSEPPPVLSGATYADLPWMMNADRAILRLVKERSLSRPVILGGSIGGQIAMRAALLHPKHFRAAVSLDGAPASPLGPAAAEVSPEERAKRVDTAFAPAFEAMPEQAWAGMWSARAMEVVKDPEYGKQLGQQWGGVPKTTGVRYVLEALAADLTPEIRRSDVPILIVAAIPEKDMPYGTRDQLKKQWANVAQLGSHVKVVYFENCRHFVHREAPDKLDSTLRDFLKRID